MRQNQISGTIQIPVSIFAKYYRNKRVSPLKRLKHTEKAENSIPFKYYRRAIAAITRYHRRGNDPEVFAAARRDLEQKIKTCEKHGTLIILENNLRAIELYQAHFASRKFQVLPVPKLKLAIRTVVISAKLDLHVVENGRAKLVKLDVCRSRGNPAEARSILAITREAAQQPGAATTSPGILMLRLQDGTQIEGAPLTQAQRKEIAGIAEDIESIWPEL